MTTTGYSNRLINQLQPSSSGQIQRVSTGCAIRDFNVVKSTAGSTAIKNHGVVFINTTHVRTIAAPCLGCRKDVIFQGTTKAMVVKTNGAKINNSTDSVLQVTLTSATGKLRGYRVVMYGASTVLWYAGIQGAPLVTVKLSSAT